MGKNLLQRLQDVVDWFLGPKADELSPDALRKARTTVLIMLFSLLLAPALVIPWLKRGIPEIWVGSIAVLTAIPGMLVLGRIKGTHVLASQVLTGIYFYGFGAVVLFAGGLSAPAVPDFAIPAVMATAIIGRRAGFMWAIASVAAVTVAFVLTSKGFADPNVLPPDEMNKARFTSTVVTILAVYSFIVSFDYTKDRMRAELETEQARVVEAHDDLHLILNNTGQGFFTIDTAGRVCGGWSEIVEEWFAVPQPGMLFADYLRDVDREFGDTFDLGWDQVAMAILPLEVSLGQLPQRFRHDGRHYELSYRPVLEDGAELPRSVVVIVTDVTIRIQRDVGRARQGDLANILERLMEDPEGVASFAGEARRIIDELDEGLGGDERYRALHTLKGICGSWGLSNISKLCHELEKELVEAPVASLPSRHLWSELKGAWREVESVFARFRPKSREGLHFDRTTVEALRAQLADMGEAGAPLLRWLELYALEPARTRLERFANEAHALADRLGKRDLHIEIVDGGVRLDSRPIEELWSSATHLVRNAVDHGVPDADGKLRFEVRLDDDALVFEVSDNGEGIDWDSVRERAQRQGVACQTPEELERALFSDGFSTRVDATMTSGRGVGLAAVKAAADKVGASVTVNSSERGASFAVRVPRDRLVAGHLPATGPGRSAAVA